jgi:hypothetical protein
MTIISAKLGANPLTGEVVSVTVVKDDGRSYGVPFSNGNADYEQYLTWLEAGNTPEPADEPTAE